MLSYLGPGAFIPTEEEVKIVFRNVNVAIFNEVKNLYLSPEGRDWKTVLEIVNRRQKMQDSPVIDDEAVWAICKFMSDAWIDSHAVSITLADENWGLTTLIPNFSLGPKLLDAITPIILCIVNLTKQQVLEFVVTTPESLSQGINSVLCKALVSLRIPAPLTKYGLLWKMPKYLITDLELPAECTAFLNNYGVIIQKGSVEGHPLGTLRADSWQRNLHYRKITFDIFELLFDNFLGRILGHAPRQSLADFSAIHPFELGYNRDPLWQFPGLRDLCAKTIQYVHPNACVVGNDIAYGSDILGLWKGEQVAAIQSPFDRTSAWIYDLDGNIICQARSI